VLHGARVVAAYTGTYARLHPFVVPALVNSAAGAVVAPHGRVMSVMGFAVTRGTIVRIDVLMDPERLARLDLSVLPISGDIG
jgi:RNA polymerase sigma-70 factor (ECF subfamily)